ncbi:hypothetical protein FRC12_015101 [Ceratobasidium sp. 428]|nr:hypothetical protein FRC12_015101 [Ceratobasidium sp. 428]
MLGALPHLRRIIVDVGGAPNLTYDSDLPDICFPSLQELCVERMASAWATSLCFLKPLLKPLSSVSVSVLHHWSDNAVLGEHWADLLLLCLSENAPYLSRLSVLTATDGPSVVPALISLDVQEAMSRLSLKTLSLNNAHFGDSTGCAFLSSAWLGIEELRCGLQKCKPAELALFARNLPQLKGLELDTDMSGSSIPYSSTQISSDSPRYTAFRRLTSSTSKTYQRSPEQTITLARYLHALWPNVCCTFAEDESFGTMGIFSYERDAHRQLQCLNTCIAQVQAESS